MRRRGRSLHVDTFPFLAVLLCAMGSLILVLMAMDLRARKAAIARGREQARRRLEEEDRAQAKRDSAYAAKKHALKKDWEKKRDMLLTQVHTAESALAEELRQVQARLAEAAGRMEDEQGNLAKLRERLKKEQSLLVGQQQALAAARKESAQVSAWAASTEQARTKLADQLVRLEKALKALKEERERDAQTYSVIPYLGKHGERRRPMYIECAADGFMFHPDKLHLTSDVEPARLRAEIQDRATAQMQRLRQEGAKDTRPYIMLLVRPNGILRYYQAQAILHGLELEFGYEFVDADWILKVPVDGPPSTSQVVQAPPDRPRPQTVGRPGFLGTKTGPGAIAGEGPSARGVLTGRAPGNGPGGWGRGTGSAGSGGQPAMGGPSGFGTGPGTGNPGALGKAPGNGNASGFGGTPGTGGPGGLGGNAGSGRPGGSSGSAIAGIGATGTGRSGPAGTASGGSGSPGIPVIGSEGPGLGSPIVPFSSNAGSGSQSGVPGSAPGHGGVLAGGPGGVGSALSSVRVTLGQPGIHESASSSGGTLAGGTDTAGSGQAGAQAGLGAPSAASGRPYPGGLGGASSAGGSPALNPLGAASNAGPGYASAGGAGAPGLPGGPAGASGSGNSLGMQGGSSGGGPGSGSAGSGTGTGGQPSGDAGPAGGPQPAGSAGAPGQSGGAQAAIGPGSPLPFAAGGGPPTNVASAPPSDALPPSTPPPPPNGKNPPYPSRNFGMPGGSGSGGSSGGMAGARGSGSADGSGSSLPPSRVVDVPNIAPETPPEPRKKPVTLRPARLGSDGEYVIFIECKADYLIVYPSQRRIAIDALNHSRFHNPLYKMIEQMITRRLSTLGPGEQRPRIVIRFLVHADGDRTMHLAYPVLEVLPGEKVRYNLQPEDDVARIISAY